MNIRNILGYLVVATLSFYGCSKAVDNGIEESISGTHTLNFVAQKDFDTRTFVVEGENTASYYWDLNDRQYFHIYENGVPPTSLEMSLSEGGKVASFKATFRDTDATHFTYSAIYAQDITTDGDVCVPAYQYPTRTSFDPAADVLVSTENVSLNDFARADENTVIRFKMRRQASVNRITVKGIRPGERVVGVSLSSDQNLGGSFVYYDEGTKFEREKSLLIDCSNWEETDRVIGSDGSLSVYFLSLPVTKASATVRVWTEKNIYKRDLNSKLTLETDVFRRFSVTMKEVSPQLGISAAGVGFYYNLLPESPERDKEFTITNVGDITANINLTTANNSSYYSLFNQGHFVLAPGETMTVSIHFNFYSATPLDQSEDSIEHLIDTIYIETEALTYEVPIYMEYIPLMEPK